MKSAVLMTLLSSFLYFSNFAFGAPSPLGFELGKAKFKEVKEKIQLKKIEDTCSEQRVYHFSKLGLDQLNGFKNGFFCFDNNEVLQGVMLNMNNGEFDFLFHSLSEKYKVIRSENYKETKVAVFADGDSTIVLMPDSSNSNQIVVFYATKILRNIKEKCDDKLHGKQKKLL